MVFISHSAQISVSVSVAVLGSKENDKKEKKVNQSEDNSSSHQLSCGGDHHIPVYLLFPSPVTTSWSPTAASAGKQSSLHEMGHAQFHGSRNKKRKTLITSNELDSLTQSMTLHRAQVVFSDSGDRAGHKHNMDPGLSRKSQPHIGCKALPQPKPT